MGPSHQNQSPTPKGLKECVHAFVNVTMPGMLSEVCESRRNSPAGHSKLLNPYLGKVMADFKTSLMTAIVLLNMIQALAQNGSIVLDGVFDDWSAIEGLEDSRHRGHTCR